MSERKDGMTKFHYLTNIVIYKGSPLEVFLTIGEDKDGNLFYNINKNNKTAERVSGTMVGGSAVIQADNSSTSDINVTLPEEKNNPTFYQSAYVGSYVLNGKTRQRVQDRY